MSVRRRLLGIRGFLPYLCVVLVNAMIDLGHKIIIQNTVFKVYDGSTQIGLTALVNACILLPFIMFFTPAGFLSDRFSKHTVMRATALFAVPLTALIYGSYLLGWFEAAFALTLILAAQSAFFSPAKYGYIKEMAGKDNLGMANGVVQAVTIIAILLGGVLFSVVFESLIGDAVTREGILKAIAPSGLLLFAGAVAQTLVALRIPEYKAGDRSLRLDRTAYIRAEYLKRNLNKIRDNETIWLSVLGLSLFWAVNQVLFAAFGAHLKEAAGVTSTVVAQGLLAIGGIGIIIGSVTAGRLSRSHIETGVIPVAAVGMTTCLALIPGMTDTVALGCLLTVYGFFGGLFVVPLNALIQFNATDSDLGTVLAGNNFVQNVAMLTFLVGTVLASLTGLSSVPIILTLSAIMGLGSYRTLRHLPQSLMRFLLRVVFAQRYRLAVSGLEHIPSQGGVLLLGNHTSWIDWAVLHLAVPRPVRFVMTRRYYDRWYLRWFLDLYRVIPITSSAASKSALRAIGETLKAGECVVLFPEGAISRNGQLGPFRRGYSIPARQADCPIVPFYMRGLWGSRWSAVSRHFRRNTDGSLARDVNVCFGPPMPSEASPREVKDAVHRLSIKAWQEFADAQPCLPVKWLQAVRRAPARLAVADSTGARLTGEELAVCALRLARTLESRPAGPVGVLLPPGAMGAVANMAVLMAGRAVVNLDPGLEDADLGECLRQAGIRTVLGAGKGARPLDGMDGMDGVDELDCTDFMDVPGNLKKEWPARVLMRLLPGKLVRLALPGRVRAEDTAAVVFTRRGGRLVGVRLSHANIITNARQVASIFPPRGSDVLLAATPLHDALGLTATLFLPLLESVPVVCHDDPRDGRTMGRLCVEFEATLLCAAPQDLEEYVRSDTVHPLMFASLSFVLSGGQCLRPECVQAFRQKFGLVVHDGYGTTETTPVATVNAPDVLNPVDLSIQQGRKPGTVGLPLPGSALRIVDPATLEDLPHGAIGRILIGGTQLMQGYLADGDQGVFLERDGIRWFVSPDMGSLDEDGFLVLDTSAKNEIRRSQSEKP
jgi:acyl-[acyl-carrier-protein]-phospholipid O-acyltransferase/long-chain-fatty-acid--[acyl-carrier-protein] ligase